MYEERGVVRDGIDYDDRVDNDSDKTKLRRYQCWTTVRVSFRLV